MPSLCAPCVLPVCAWCVSCVSGVCRVLFPRKYECLGGGALCLSRIRQTSNARVRKKNHLLLRAFWTFLFGEKASKFYDVETHTFATFSKKVVHVYCWVQHDGRLLRIWSSCFFENSQKLPKKKKNARFFFFRPVSCGLFKILLKKLRLPWWFRKIHAARGRFFEQRNTTNH